MADEMDDSDWSDVSVPEYMATRGGLYARVRGTPFGAWAWAVHRDEHDDVADPEHRLPTVSVVVAEGEADDLDAAKRAAWGAMAGMEGA